MKLPSLYQPEIRATSQPKPVTVNTICPSCGELDVYRSVRRCCRVYRTAVSESLFARP